LNASITTSYRLCSRPRVKVESRYRSGSVMIEIDDIELLPFTAITGDELSHTGSPILKAFAAVRHTPDRSTMTRSLTTSSCRHRA
jgi:hypothetical protein